MTPLEIALAVGKALESVGVEYFLGGSMASSVQGEPRLTLRVQGKALNDAYLDAWARKLDLVELLARARAAVTAA